MVEDGLKGESKVRENNWEIVANTTWQRGMNASKAGWLRIVREIESKGLQIIWLWEWKALGLGYKVVWWRSSLTEDKGINKIQEHSWAFACLFGFSFCLFGLFGLRGNEISVDYFKF